MIRRNRSYLEEFAIRIREHNLFKATRERLLIVRHIHEQYRQRESFTDVDVAESIKVATPRRVSLSTVYRTLRCLVEVELLDRLEQAPSSQSDSPLILYRLPVAWRD